MFVLVAVVGLRRILRPRFRDNKLHGIANQNELRARCALIIPGLGAQAALHHDHVSFLVTRQRVGPASKTLARDKRGFFLGDLRFVAVAAIARDSKESHLGAIISKSVFDAVFDRMRRRQSKENHRTRISRATNHPPVQRPARAAVAPQVTIVPPRRGLST